MLTYVKYNTIDEAPVNPIIAMHVAIVRHDNVRGTLFVRAEPKQSMTALEVKFSLAMSSKLDHWRV